MIDHAWDVNTAWLYDLYLHESLIHDLDIRVWKVWQCRHVCLGRIRARRECTIDLVETTFGYVLWWATNIGIRGGTDCYPKR
jgi:hypothetical protein